MSEEKLYVVKNDEGKYWDFEDRDDFWELTYASCPTTDNELDAKDVINDYGGHIVTFIEEPKKVVLTKEQAKIVDDAHSDEMPAGYIFSKSDDDEELLMNAYVNGYTVAKEKKYRLPVPKSWCGDNDHYWRKESDGTLTWSILSGRAEDFEFTKDEIGKFELQDCEKEEVTDDDD